MLGLFNETISVTWSPSIFPLSGAAAASDWMAGQKYSTACITSGMYSRAHGIAAFDATARRFRTLAMSCLTSRRWW